MVPDVNCKRGFSLVEIIVSMVIVGVVSLLVMLIITSSIKFNLLTRSGDEAYEVARQKLVQLENAGIAVQSSGTEYVSRDGKTYTVGWTITVEANSSRKLAKVNVTYRPPMGSSATKTISISGYIAAAICPIAPGVDQAPTAVTPTTATVRCDAAIGTNVIQLLTATDPNAGDILKISIPSDQYFAIGADGVSVITKAALPTVTTPTQRTLNIVVTDCNGLSSGNLPITITINPITYSVNVTTSGGGTGASATASPSTNIASGGSSTITFNPGIGCAFDHYTNGGNSYTSTTTGTTIALSNITQDQTVVVFFKSTAIVIPTGGGVQYSISAGQVYQINTSSSVTLTADILNNSTIVYQINGGQQQSIGSYYTNFGSVAPQNGAITFTIVSCTAGQKMTFHD